MSKKSKEVLQEFFTAFGNQDFEGILNTFHPNTKIFAIKDKSRSDNEIYGTYVGKEEVPTFLTNLGNTFDTQSFSIENIIGEDNVAFANGSFVHKIKSTDKLFPSDWALYAKIEDDKILEYHFYEDSAAFEKANN